MIGVDKNIAVTSPQYADMVLTSVEKRMTNAVYDIIKASAVDKAEIADYLGNLKNGGTALSDFGAFDSKISAETKAGLKKLEEGIIAGTINPLQ